jgi:hypothetical protein
MPGEQSAVFPGAPTGLVFPGDPGVSRAIAPGYQRDGVSPCTEQYTVSIQRQPGNSTVITASYTGSDLHHLLTLVEASHGNPPLCLSLSQPDEVAPALRAAGHLATRVDYLTTIGNSTYTDSAKNRLTLGWMISGITRFGMGFPLPSPTRTATLFSVHSLTAATPTDSVRVRDLAPLFRSLFIRTPHGGPSSRPRLRRRLIPVAEPGPIAG